MMSCGNSLLMKCCMNEFSSMKLCLKFDSVCGMCIMCGSVCGVCMMFIMVWWLNVLWFLSLMMKFRFLFSMCGNGCVGLRLIGVSMGSSLLRK